MRASLLAAFLTSTLAVAQTPSSDVSVGVFPFLEGNMDSRISEIVTNCQTRGIDTVYVSVFRATGPSTGDLWVTDSAGDWNVAWGPVRSTGAGIHLQNLITACHAQNIRVVGVMKCFSDTVQPTDAAHKQYLLNVIDYFVNAWKVDGTPVYDLDGIALDYIRFVGAATGNDPLQVTNFLGQVRQLIGSLSLHCYLVASRFTFDGGTYDANFQSYTTVINSFSSQYGQNWQQMAQYVDVLMPMAYTADGTIYNTAARHRAYVQQTALYARQAATLAGFPARRVVPTIKTYTGEGETTTVTTIDESIKGALLGGADGYQSFRYELLVNTPAWWGPMQNWAVPGVNFPQPVVTTSSPNLGVQVDPTTSRDNDQLASTLQVRFDYDNNGVFDTGWQAMGAGNSIARAPGSHIAAVQVRDAQNHVSTTRRRFNAGPALTLTPPFVFASAGGSVQMDLRTGPAAVGCTYLMLPSISGTSPGIAWQPGFTVPINYDFLTEAIVTSPNSPILVNGSAQFDSLGRATATLNVPPGVLSPFAGLPLHWTFIAVDLLYRPLCVAEADAMLILQ